jgi:hypothetical protein
MTTVVHKVIFSYVVFDSYFKSFQYVLMKVGSLAHLHLWSFAIDVGFRVKVCVCKSFHDMLKIHLKFHFGFPRNLGMCVVFLELSFQ